GIFSSQFLRRAKDWKRRTINKNRQFSDNLEECSTRRSSGDSQFTPRTKLSVKHNLDKSTQPNGNIDDFGSNCVVYMIDNPLMKEYRKMLSRMVHAVNSEFASSVIEPNLRQCSHDTLNMYTI
ncbi:unnamed protein product, partial [Nesidiocoris tenuis]